MDVYEALADPTRRDIFERLARKPMSVGELAQGLPVSRPAVSQHLKVLKAAGLVTLTLIVAWLWPRQRLGQLAEPAHV